MLITTQTLGKKYRREWIVRGVNLQLQAGNSYTFVGPNGSGKSTLLQLLSGHLPLSAGTISFQKNGLIVEPEAIFSEVVLAAPYLELIEEFTLLELLQFHQQFKPFKAGLTPDAVAERMQLAHARHKEIKFFSSGMKQRVKLGLAFLSVASLVLLDEPTANLDAAGASWYHREVNQLAPDQLLLICSNQPAEYDFCPNVLDVMQWK